MHAIKFVTMFLLIMVTSVKGNAQEICNNGKDDDNDGLVDLKDPDCSCKDSLPGLNYLDNPSFEDYVTCPTDPSFGLGLLGFPYWFSEPRGAVVPYYNLDCPNKYFLLTNTDTFPPPYPLPDGKGYILLSNYGDNGYGNKYYAGACLKNTLRANKKYTFEGYIGFSPNDKLNRIFSPYKLILFGNPDCTASRYTNDISRGCPLIIDPSKPNYEWEQLGSITVYGKGNWVKVRIDFVPSADIKVLLVGPDCVNYGGDFRSYCYADNFSLSEAENFAFKTITVANDCLGGIQLTAPPAVNVTYQWYKDSIAIIGATNPKYTVLPMSSAGSYNVRLLFPNTCIVSSPVHIDPGVLKVVTLGNDTTLCAGEKLILQANPPSLKYVWQDGSTSSSYTIKQAGTYSLTVTDNYGCINTSNIKVNFKQCTDCPIEMPSAFTPNGDGKNDVFKVLTTCSLIYNFYLGIYNKGGQKIFETKDVTVYWDGTWKKQSLPLGSYIYVLQYKKYGTPNIVHKKGTITLLR